jgi:hypothetical protein
MQKISILFLATLLTVMIPHHLHSMEAPNNGGQEDIMGQVHQIVNQSYISYNSKNYFWVESFQQYIHANLAHISPDALTIAYAHTLRRLTSQNLAQKNNELALCHRDYTAAFIALNSLKPGSVDPLFIENCQQLTETYFDRFLHAETLENQLHIARHRWRQCLCQKYESSSWPTNPE